MSQSRPSHRSQLYALLAANGPANLAQIATALHWDRVRAMRAIQHALESSVIVVHAQPARGQRVYAAGEKLPRDAAKAKRTFAPYHRPAPEPSIKMTRSGSGQVAPLTYRQQLMREILAEHERAKGA